MRRRFGSQRGFALAELVVVIAVLGLIMAGVFALQKQGQEAYLFGSSRVETQQNARVALDLMSRELRSAASVTTITSATDATDITFMDQSSQTIRYYLSGTSPDFTLNRTVAGTNTPLIGGVKTLKVTSYQVYDVYSGTYTTTNDVTKVKVIKIALVTKTEQSASSGTPGDQHATMESTVKLRATLQ